jgi:predicted nucleic acid-binding Zn ribbon protein
VTGAADSDDTLPGDRSFDGELPARAAGEGASIDELLNDHRGRARFARTRFAERRPQRARDVLTQVIARKGYAAVRGAEELADAWRGAVPAEFAKLTRVAGLRAGRLEVVAASSAVIEEIGFQKARLLEALRAAAPTARINDLRLRVGPIDV